MVSSSSRPDWVSGRSASYGEERYLIGVGFGSERGVAENAAFAAISRIFSANIDSQLRDREQSTSSYGSGANAQAEQQEIEQLTKVSTQKVISGATIAEAWVDPQSKQIYALAVLEREVAAQALLDEIAKLDARIKAEVGLADAAQGSGEKVMHLSRALAASAAREKLNAELRIVDPHGSGVVAAVTGQDLVTRMAQAQASVRTGLQVTGDQAEQVERCLADALTSEGYLLADSDVEMLFRANVRIEKAGFIGVSSMARAGLNVELVDTATRKVLRSARDDQKVGRPSWNATVQLAVTKLCEDSVPKVVASLKQARP
jgi:hypothetical protein